MVRAVNVRPSTTPAAGAAQKNVRLIAVEPPVTAPTSTELPLAIHTPSSRLWAYSAAAGWVLATDGAGGAPKNVIYGTANPSLAPQSGAGPTALQLPVFINTANNTVWFYDSADNVWIAGSSSPGLSPIFGAGPPAAIPTASQLPYYTDTTNDQFYVFDPVDMVWVNTSVVQVAEAYLGGQSGGQSVLNTEQAIATFPVPKDTWAAARQISLRGHVSLVGTGGVWRARLDSATGPLLGSAGISSAGFLELAIYATVGGAAGTLKSAGKVGNNNIGLQTNAAIDLTADHLIVVTAQGDGTNGLLNDFMGLVVG